MSAEEGWGDTRIHLNREAIDCRERRRERLRRLKRKLERVQASLPSILDQYSLQQQQQVAAALEL